MKRISLVSLVLIALTAVSFVNPPNALVGRWQQLYKGATTLLVFRPNNTFDVFINGKVFTSGKYTVRQDTFALVDPGCHVDYYGTYKFAFFVPDSVRFTAIADTCQGRRNDLHQFTAGRQATDAVKTIKP
ncbi:hypothetical protein [Spirosoma jeollabukense]